MKVLFINYPTVPDMTESFLYDGLVGILGRENVVDWPQNPYWHSPTQQTSGVLAATSSYEPDCKCKKYDRSEIIKLLANGGFDFVILGEDLPDVNAEYETLRESTWSIPVVRVDGFDDQQLHGYRAGISLYFKRETPTAAFSAVRPMPVSLPTWGNVWSRIYKAIYASEKKYDVSFMCTPCTRARQRVHVKLTELAKAHGWNYFSALSKVGQHHTFGERALPWFEYLQTIAQSKVSVTISAWEEERDGFHQTTDFRYFEIPGVGTYMVAQVPRSFVEYDFEAEAEYGPIRRRESEASDLEEQVLWALTHETERERKAKIAQEKALSKHTTYARAERFLSTVKWKCELT